MAAVTSSPEVDGLVGIWGGGSWDPTQISGGEDPVDDDGAAGENRASLLGLADDGGIAWRRYLVEGIVFACLVTTLGELEMCGYR